MRYRTRRLLCAAAQREIQRAFPPVGVLARRAGAVHLRRHPPLLRVQTSAPRTAHPMNATVDDSLLGEFRLRRDRRQALRLQIDRRARELAARDQARYFQAILFDVYRGKIAPELVPYWEPLTGDIAKAI
jgi:hypothetical protein